jgi:hypothetical protein
MVPMNSPLRETAHTEVSLLDGSGCKH